MTVRPLSLLHVSAVSAMCEAFDPRNGVVLRLRKMLFEFEKLEILPPNCRLHQPKLRVYHQKAPKLGINI